MHIFTPPSVPPLESRYIVFVGFGRLKTRKGQIYRCCKVPGLSAPALVQENPSGEPNVIPNAHLVVRGGGFMPVEPELPYPLLTKNGDKPRERVTYYDIPVDRKAEVLAQVWPFKEPVPSLDEWRFDLHEGEWFQVRDYLVVRDQERNWLVSPYYPDSGGTALDWHSGDPAGSKHPKADQR